MTAGQITPSQITLVQDSFRLVGPIRVQAAALFYDRLFAIDPGTRALFGNADIAVQGAKLMAALGFVVTGLRQPESLLATVRALAVRHVGYGVVDAHYGSVGTALLWTLEQGLGDACTPETLEAWAAAYALLSGVMIAAAHEHGMPAAA